MSRDDPPMETLSDFIARGFALWTKCECGRIEYVIAETALEVCRAKGLSERIEDIKPLMRCKKCRKRAVKDIRPWKF